jgi:hypothetical protein
MKLAFVSLVMKLTYCGHIHTYFNEAKEHSRSTIITLRNLITNTGTKHTGVAVTLQTCIQEVPGSNVGHIMDYSDCEFSFSYSAFK